MTPQNHAEEGQDAAERTGPMGPYHPHPRSQNPQAEDYQNAQVIPLGCAAGEQQGERQGRLDARFETTTPPSYGGVPFPHRPASRGRAPLRTAPDTPFRHDRSLPAAHVAHDHLHSSACAMAGETGCAGAGGQETDPHDVESRAAGALIAAANARTGNDGERRSETCRMASGRLVTTRLAISGLASRHHVVGRTWRAGRPRRTRQPRLFTMILVVARPPFLACHQRTAPRRTPPVRRTFHVGAHAGPLARLIITRRGPRQFAPLIFDAAAYLISHSQWNNRETRGRARRRKRAGSRFAVRGTLVDWRGGRIDRGGGWMPRSTLSDGALQ
ncbi:unnamed protein product [Closterium sp. Yama58-4]|nr:unnamed protein product [Closterium sp. Yama58-4]